MAFRFIDDEELPASRLNKIDDEPWKNINNTADTQAKGKDTYNSETSSVVDNNAASCSEDEDLLCQKRSVLAKNSKGMDLYPKQTTISGGVLHLWRWRLDCCEESDEFWENIVSRYGRSRDRGPSNCRKQVDFFKFWETEVFSYQTLYKSQEKRKESWKRRKPWYRYFYFYF